MSKLSQKMPMVEAYDPFAPISKEEALDKARGHDGHYRDGFDGGQETPSDSDTIDPLVFPQREAPKDDWSQKWDEKRVKDHAVIEQVENERFTRSRDFSISEADVTGNSKKGA